MKKNKKNRKDEPKENLTFTIKTQNAPPPPPDRHIKEGQYPKETNEEFQIPDPKKHQIISFIKSFIRITGYGLILIDINIAVIVLIFSELIGILEELA